MLYKTENSHGGDIYEGNIALDFSANINPFGTPEGVKAGIISALNGLSRYPDPYCRALVSAIAAHENIAKNMVLCGNGAAELIYSFCASEKPKKAVELAPTFAEYALPLKNAEIKRYFLSEANGFRLTQEFLDFIEKNRPDTVFLCNPNNPTGLAADPALIEGAAELTMKTGARLFLDECFMDLCDKAESLVPRLAKYRNTVILKAFTKSYGMAGARLGYVLTSDQELLFRMSGAAQPWNVSSMAQAAGIAALEERVFLEKTRALIRQERPRLSSGLSRFGIKVFDSNANFLLFKAAPGLDQALLKKGIKIRNCGNFFGLNGSFYRIAVKLPEENNRLIEAIGECL